MNERSAHTSFTTKYMAYGLYFCVRDWSTTCGTSPPSFYRSY